jgi:hypothetical protein
VSHHFARDLQIEAVFGKVSSGRQSDSHQEDHHEATGPTQESIPSPGGQLTRPVNLVIVYDINDAAVLCRDCDESLTSFWLILSHRCRHAKVS